jgi:triosephosphate isomerase
MRTKIVAGNWKMNKTFSEAEDILHGISEEIEELELNGIEVVVCPPSLYLELATDVADESRLAVGAQNVNENERGAFTGEISIEMLKSVGTDYCIIGHSERRTYFMEDNELLAKKVDACIDGSITPIFCFGEVLEEREMEIHFNVVKNQLEKGIFHLSEKEIQNVVLAYEPVWAIGTGRTATPEQAQEMHAFIRKVLTDKYGESVAQEITILYGGSCNAKNAKELFSNPDVDGGLIGGASLKVEDFVTIIKSI